MDQFLGFLLGILGSFLFWWLFTHWLVPKVRFEESILVKPSRDHPGRSRYFIKFRNEGKRDLIDVTLTAAISIQTRPGGANSWASCRLAFHGDGSIEHSIPRIPAGKNRLITLHAARSAQIGFEGSFSDEVREGAKKGTLDLRDLMVDGASRDRIVRVRVSLFGYDAFSGARKLYQSKFYHVDDLADPTIPA